jgi:ABC-type branched-subunit amino acid transport system permease subunit
MNPFDQTDLGTKFLYGIGAPIAGMFLNIVPAEINPWLQTFALLTAIIVSTLSAISIITKNLMK